MSLRYLIAMSLVLVGCGSSSDGSPAASGGAAGMGGMAGLGGAAGAPEPPVDVIVSTPSGAVNEDEPSIVVTAGGRIVMAWDNRLSGAFQVAARVSDDGGKTWGEIQTLPLKPEQNVAANTSLTATEDGTVFLSWGAEKVTQTGQRSELGVYVAKLPPDAPAFGAPMEVTDPAAEVGVYDQPFIAATSQGLFLAYSQFSTSLMSAKMVTRFSQDGGATWSTSELPSTGLQGFMNGVQLCRAEGDRAYLTMVDANLGIALWRSDDGGQSFGDAISIPLPEEFGQLTFMRDGNCVAHGEDVWILYGLSDDVATSNHEKIAHLSSLRLAHSGDGGQSIESRVDVGDPSAGKYFLLSRLAREDSGALDITYYAGSGDGDDQASYRWGRSTDGGKTFPTTVLRSPVVFEQSRVTSKFLGDYMGLVWQGGRLYSAFVDNSAASHIVLHAEDTP
ncbi:MAG: exo-alpha-sialidase [Myxococcales bacterium]|nr:exo-alpha-sialidase [Myxococcales bacterium]MCB9576294.1 exo-alpha-sialidase [Polyangiaceae bacterium]